MINKKKQLKKLPKFKNEDEEREFWATADSTDYINWDNAMINPSFPNLKPSTKTISIRLTLSMLDRLKVLANSRDIPYQSFIKMILAERIKEENNC
ncbi:BrnA antitoxin family protein [Candidatus Parcubacteria bacterium]|nr:BrnA antitoxin family protein [Candidatus Parcubacteria bacterium]